MILSLNITFPLAHGFQIFSLFFIEDFLFFHRQAIQIQIHVKILFLLEGRKGGKKGFLKVLGTLFIEDEKGNFSKEMLDIYGNYKR